VLFGAASFMPRGAPPAYLRAALTYLRRPRLDPLAMIAENRSVTGFNLIWLWDRVERLGPMWDACAAALPAPPLIGRRVPFDAAPVALRHLQSGDSIGKIVLEVESPG
jgi:alcohol dehydrogenase